MKPAYSQIQAAKKHLIKQSTLAGILKDKILAVANARQKGKHIKKEKSMSWRRPYLSGLYFYGMATKGFVLAGERPKGMKMAKERLTVLVCANMDGSEKRQLLVIGKEECTPKEIPQDSGDAAC